MACRGVHFALSVEQEQAILSATNDEELMEVVGDIEEEWDKEALVESDKAWDAIHRCLTNGELSLGRDVGPLSLVVGGGRQLHNGKEYIVAYVTREDVVKVAGALQEISESWLREKYFTLLKQQEYDGEIGEEDFEYTWDNLLDVKEFFEKAASVGRSVIFTVDQ